MISIKKKKLRSNLSLLFFPGVLNKKIPNVKKKKKKDKEALVTTSPYPNDYIHWYIYFEASNTKKHFRAARCSQLPGQMDAVCS